MYQQFGLSGTNVILQKACELATILAMVQMGTSQTSRQWQHVA